MTLTSVTHTYNLRSGSGQVESKRCPYNLRNRPEQVPSKQKSDTFAKDDVAHVFDKTKPIVERVLKAATHVAPKVDSMAQAQEKAFTDAPIPELQFVAGDIKGIVNRIYPISQYAGTDFMNPQDAVRAQAFLDITDTVMSTVVSYILITNNKKKYDEAKKIDDVSSKRLAEIGLVRGGLCITKAAFGIATFALALKNIQNLASKVCRTALNVIGQAIMITHLIPTVSQVYSSIVHGYKLQKYLKHSKRKAVEYLKSHLKLKVEDFKKIQDKMLKQYPPENLEGLKKPLYGLEHLLSDGLKSSVTKFIDQKYPLASLDEKSLLIERMTLEFKKTILTKITTFKRTFGRDTYELLVKNHAASISNKVAAEMIQTVKKSLVKQFIINALVASAAFASIVGYILANVFSMGAANLVLFILSCVTTGLFLLVDLSDLKDVFSSKSTTTKEKGYMLASFLLMVASVGCSRLIAPFGAVAIGVEATLLVLATIVAAIGIRSSNQSQPPKPSEQSSPSPA